MKVLFKGMNEIRAKSLQIVEQKKTAVGTAMVQELEIDATECKKRTPVDTGDLRNSIHVEGPVVTSRTVSAQIVAGGIAAAYAIVVHNDTEAFHAVGQDHFISSVINESAPYMTARIAARVTKNET